jgi:nitrogen-specific signal transduction histidine kinase
VSPLDDLSQRTASADPRRAVIELAELAGGLAHELCNPLSTIMINLKLLAEDLQDSTPTHAMSVGAPC